MSSRRCTCRCFEKLLLTVYAIRLEAEAKHFALDSKSFVKEDASSQMLLVSSLKAWNKVSHNPTQS